MTDPYYQETQDTVRAVAALAYKLSKGQAYELTWQELLETDYGIQWDKTDTGIRVRMKNVNTIEGEAIAD